MEAPYLSIERVSRDSDLVELRFRADAGRFRGEVESYTTAIDLEALTDHLQGFPRTVSHVVRFQTLNFRGNMRVDLVFRCYDLTGQAVLRVQMRELDDTTHLSRFEQRADIVFSVEPTQVEELRKQLVGLSGEPSGSAVLKGIWPHQ